MQGAAPPRGCVHACWLVWAASRGHTAQCKGAACAALTTWACRSWCSRSASCIDHAHQERRECFITTAHALQAGRRHDDFGSGALSARRHRPTADGTIV